MLQNLYVLFSINGAITEVQVTFAKGTDTTPYHDRPWLSFILDPELEERIKEEGTQLIDLTPVDAALEAIARLPPTGANHSILVCC